MNRFLSSAIFNLFRPEEVIFCYETACELNDLSNIYGNKFYFYHSNEKFKNISYTSETRWDSPTQIVPIYRETLEDLDFNTYRDLRYLTVEEVIKEMLEQKYDYFMQMTYEALSDLWEAHDENWDFVLRLCDTPDKLKFFNEIRQDCEEYYCD